MRIVSLMAVLLMAAAVLPVTPTAAQAPPTRFYGIATIDGAAAPVGTVVKGFINGVECGSTEVTTEDGLYILDVAHDSVVAGCGTEDAPVTFTVNDLPANETSGFTQGTFRNVDLSASTQPPPAPSEEPTAPPAEPVEEPAE